MESKLKITQIRSTIGKTKTQRKTVRALGIKKLNQSVIHKKTPQILGMLDRIRHLVRIEEVK